MNVAKLLEEAGALRFGEFTLASGETSEYYVDVKRATAKPKTLRRLAEALSERVPDDVDAVACVALGAVPLGVAVSLETGLDLIVVRKAEKDHGAGDRIEGEADGAQVCLIEDVVTTGASAVEAVEVLREAGAEVATCLAVVDRQQGGAGRFEAHDVTFHPLIDAEDLLEGRH